MGAKRPSENQNGLAKYLEERPALKDWDRPTAWLLGAQMISSLRQLILSAIHTGFDLRDWMSPERHGVRLHANAKGRPPRPMDRGDNPNEYWFDFVADTGDAPALVYCLARAMQRPQLRVEGAERETLPRGRLLILGGDSAYPVADETAIRERWQAPLWWAHDRGGGRSLEDPIPIYAIPGNHDYYDALDGFNRQFRKQATPDGEPSFKYPDKGPPLRLPGYRRTQSASYFALHLPFDWHLWGVDLGPLPDEPRPIDARQQQYFRELHESPPKKLIVVTALPVAVHHAHAEKLEGAFEQLGLDRAFARDGQLDEKYTRLDLSGDVHLYERYWGTTVEGDRRVHGDDGRVADDRVGHKPAVERANYAAVASGLGGAFHHPIQIRDVHDEQDRITPARSWPPEKESKTHLGDVLTRPRKVFQAGSIGIVGAALGLFFYLFSRTSWGDGWGVLELPGLLWTRCWDRAGDRFLDFGAVFLFIVAVGLWVFGTIQIRKRTRRILESMFEPADEGSFRARLDGFLGGGDPDGRTARFLRWTGANRRVITSVLLRCGWWIVWIISVAAVVLLGWLLLRHTTDTGINFAAALLIAAMMAFPFITNDFRWSRLAPFLLLGLIHGIAQLYAPQLWAEATVQLVAPMLLLGAYWSIRPIAQLAFEKHGRWLVPGWIGLVAALLVGPMLLPRCKGLEWTGAPTVMALLCFVLGLWGLAIAWEWVRDEQRRWTKRQFIGLLVMLPVQVATFFLLPELHEQTSSETEWWLGLVAAVIAGAFFSCLWLGWYLAVCLQWGWHGNDAGSVARVDDYAEFVRVKLTRDSAEVWAIAVDANPKITDPMDPQGFAADARLIDHFVVKAKGT